MTNIQKYLSTHGLFMFRKKVKAIITNSKNEFLIVQYATPGPTGKAIRTCPGGGVDRGEMLHDALFREIHEEVGLHASDILLHAEKTTSLRYWYSLKRILRLILQKNRWYLGENVTLFFLTLQDDDASIDLSISGEHGAWRWVSEEEFGRVMQKEVAEVVLKNESASPNH